MFYEIPMIIVARWQKRTCLRTPWLLCESLQTTIYPNAQRDLLFISPTHRTTCLPFPARLAFSR